ncbi:flagellar basal body rod protein FlgB [Shouchella lehensis]|nr:flagellar basal body rod protein FlgB [Shouchella lehensis]KQL58631.1 flagellar biosynthesis protein FlgB [Alkalicoccobacillus plakortidis]MBG9784307.1 flagellar basal body rod protein FlgB [Shouchella lehensis]
MMFTTQSISVLEEALHFAANQQKVISSNIANVDTPDYKEKSVSFQNVLQTAQSNSNEFQAKQTNERHLAFPLPQSHTQGLHERLQQYNHNGNSVDIDKQMSKMAENQLYHQALVDRISSNFQSLETAIKGSR